IHFTNAWIDETVDSVGLRLRGNTSRYSQKKSFKLSFNTFIPRRQFYDVEKLNLNGEHNDPSIIRSKLCWDLFPEIGMTTSRAAHAAVYINNEYYGLYILVEHIDDEFLQDNYSDDSGNLWKCLWPADLTYRGPNPEDYYPYYDDYRPYDLKTNVDEYDYSQMARLIDIINNTPDNLFADSLEQILMVPEMLKYFAMNVLVGGWDDYWFLMNNYYLYFEPTLGKFHWIPYDYDNTFGVDWFGVDWTSVDPYTFANIEETQGGEPGPRPLTERIMANAQYRNLYSHFLEFYRDNVYDLSLWESRLDRLKDLITPWAEDDLFRTLDYGFTMDDFNDS
ncbi:MAG: CotH kinase family protein, partial [Candidatus Marinimicrobia bacterium]|nr:CotH kinase family protein [Candidatus Neomarinimicrobiota bacterium]